MIYAITLAGDTARHLGNHWGDGITYMFALLVLTHGVNSFPTPANKYGAWLLGVIQYAVGLRYKGANTIHGDDSRTISMGKAGTGDGSVFETVKGDGK